MNARLIALPSDEILQAELLSLRYDVTSSGQVKLESKRTIRKKGMPSPDRADALALAFMRPPSLQIWTGYETFLRPRPLAGVPYAPLPHDPPADGDDDGDGGAAPANAGAGSPSPYKVRGRREAAGEGTGDAPPTDAPDGADINRHSGVGRNPEGAGASPAPQNPADIPLDRHFIRF